MATFTLKQGEAKYVRFDLRQDGSPVNLSGATFFLGFKTAPEATDFVITKDDQLFDKAQAVNGVVRVLLNTADTLRDPATYVGELKIEFLDGSIDKSENLLLVIESAITG